jgi:RpiR family transcriptional regulator, carbohydrate utilization regulator
MSTPVVNARDIHQFHTIPTPRPSPSDRNLPLLPYLKCHLASLTRIERRIAACVLADPEAAMTSSIAEIKARSNASVGSIVRFCRRLGFKGFADFKLALARALAQTELKNTGASQKGSLIEELFHGYARSLNETATINRLSTYERVAEALSRAGHIEFFAMGLCYPTAHTAFCKALALNLPARAQADVQMQQIAAVQMKKGDVAFGISTCGTTWETVACLEAARAAGAQTIGLTHALNSPLTAASDLALFATPIDLTHSTGALQSRLTALAVVEALFTCLAAQRAAENTARSVESQHARLERQCA